MSDEKRGVRILKITRELLCEFLTQGIHCYEVIENGLPKDAIVTGASEHIFFVEDRIAIRLVSAEWADVPIGERIPELPEIKFQTRQPGRENVEAHIAVEAAVAKGRRAAGIETTRPIAEPLSDGGCRDQPR